MQGRQTDELFLTLAEQLKTPLLQIARLAELSEQTHLPRIAVISEHTLRLVDAYVQCQEQTKLLLEPLTASAVLYEVAHDLRAFAKQWDFEIDVDQRGKTVPVMAHRHSLLTMLTLLGASLIEAEAEGENKKIPRRLILGTHRSAQGTVVGVFGSHLVLSQRALQMMRALHGRATQTSPSLGLAGGAGLAIADRLSGQLSSPLRAYRHRSMSGIGSVLLPSKQLQLV